MTKIEKIIAFLMNAKAIEKVDNDNFEVDGKKIHFCRGENGFIACKVEGFGFPVINAEAVTVEMALSGFQ